MNKITSQGGDKMSQVIINLLQQENALRKKAMIDAEKALQMTKSNLHILRDKNINDELETCQTECRVLGKLLVEQTRNKDYLQNQNTKLNGQISELKNLLSSALQQAKSSSGSVLKSKTKEQEYVDEINRRAVKQRELEIELSVLKSNIPEVDLKEEFRLSLATLESTKSLLNLSEMKNENAQAEIESLRVTNEVLLTAKNETHISPVASPSHQAAVSTIQQNFEKLKNEYEGLLKSKQADLDEYLRVNASLQDSIRKNAELEETLRSTKMTKELQISSIQNTSDRTQVDLSNVSTELASLQNRFADLSRENARLSSDRVVKTSEPPTFDVAVLNTERQERNAMIPREEHEKLKQELKRLTDENKGNESGVFPNDLLLEINQIVLDCKSVKTESEILKFALRSHLETSSPVLVDNIDAIERNDELILCLSETRSKCEYMELSMVAMKTQSQADIEELTSEIARLKTECSQVQQESARIKEEFELEYDYADDDNDDDPSLQVDWDYKRDLDELRSLAIEHKTQASQLKDFLQSLAAEDFLAINLINQEAAGLREEVIDLRGAMKLMADQARNEIE